MEGYIQSVRQRRNIFIGTGAQKPKTDTDRESVEAIVAILQNKYGFQRGKHLLAYHPSPEQKKRDW